MKAVLQRVRGASVLVGQRTIGSIKTGFVVFLGIARGDSDNETDWMLDQIIKLRVFADEAKKMNRSITEVGGELLIIPQFTLFADTTKGRRPSFFQAAPPEDAQALFESFVRKAKTLGVPVASGIFGEHMDVSLLNDGPVTILLDSHTKKDHI